MKIAFPETLKLGVVFKLRLFFHSIYDNGKNDNQFPSELTPRGGGKGTTAEEEEERNTSHESSKF
jgi:hypothetical protein